MTPPTRRIQFISGVTHSVNEMERSSKARVTPATLFPIWRESFFHRILRYIKSTSLLSISLSHTASSSISGLPALSLSLTNSIIYICPKSNRPSSTIHTTHTHTHTHTNFPYIYTYTCSCWIRSASHSRLELDQLASRHKRMQSCNRELGDCDRTTTHSCRRSPRCLLRRL